MTEDELNDLLDEKTQEFFTRMIAGVYDEIQKFTNDQIVSNKNPFSAISNSVVFQLILNRSIKSLQVHMDEYVDILYNHINLVSLNSEIEDLEPSDIDKLIQRLNEKDEDK